MHLQVNISAENAEQSDLILNKLLEEKLVTGGQIIAAPARFLWKGEVIDMNYYMIQAFTLEKNKEKIIQEVENVSIEEVPFVYFVSISGNKKFFQWIEETLA